MDFGSCLGALGGLCNGNRQGAWSETRECRTENPKGKGGRQSKYFMSKYMRRKFYCRPAMRTHEFHLRKARKKEEEERNRWQSSNQEMERIWKVAHM